jgi:hypothetical protein
MKTKDIIFPPSIWKIWNIRIPVDNHRHVYDHNQVLYDIMLYVPHIREQFMDDVENES